MSRDKTLLHPELQEILAIFEQKCKDSGLNVLITQTWRTKAEQEALYAQGRTTSGSIVTNCKYPNSPHCWGVAFDFCRNVRGSEYDDSDGFFKKVGTIGKSLGLFWGGNFKSFVDKPHLELLKYLPNNSVKTLMNEYGTPANFKATWTPVVTKPAAVVVEQNDSTPDSWGKESVEWAKANKIIFGDENGNLKLHKVCTRQEMAVFMQRMSNLVDKNG